MFKEVISILQNRTYRFALFVMVCVGVIFGCVLSAVALALLYLMFG